MIAGSESNLGPSVYQPNALPLDPSTYKVKQTAIYYNKTQHANFRGRPLFSSYKTTFKQQLHGKNEMQDTHLLNVQLFASVVLVSNV